jgi:hypothetical protein
MHRKTILGRTAGECKVMGQALNGPPGIMSMWPSSWYVKLRPAKAQDPARCRGVSPPGARRQNPIYKRDSFERKLELDRFSMSAYTACMSDQAGLASHAGAFLAPVSTRTRCEVVRVWERGPKMLSLRDSLTAGAFLLLYLAVYLTAGFAGVNLIEWAWMRVFG